MILAIDPGPTASGFAMWDGVQVRNIGKATNNTMLLVLLERKDLPEFSLCIEMIASYGMPVGAEVFETCTWIGRFEQMWGRPSARLSRKQVGLHLCNSPRANDATVRRALIDRIGPPGTKKNPGPTFGITGDMWAALAVAVTAWDMQEAV